MQLPWDWNCFLHGAPMGAVWVLIQTLLSTACLLMAAASRGRVCLISVPAASSTEPGTEKAQSCLSRDWGNAHGGLTVVSTLLFSGHPLGSSAVYQTCSLESYVLKLLLLRKHRVPSLLRSKSQSQGPAKDLIRNKKTCFPTFPHQSICSVVYCSIL